MFDVNKCRSYDLLGNLTALIDPQTHLTLSYDALSRLTAANDPDYTQSWSYDRNGNRLSQWHHGELTGYGIDPASNRLLQAGSRAYQYDANGNLINDGKHSYHYDARNRLTAVNNGQTARYTHNALGQRIHNPNFVQRIRNAVYQALTDFYQDWSDKRAAQASARQQNADALSQQAQAKTEEAAQLQQQADNLSQQAEAKQQEAQQLRAEANDHLQQANQLEQQAAECRALAEQGGTAPTTSQTTVFNYDEHGQLIGEYDEAGNARQETVWLGNLPVATVQNGNTYAVHADHLGTPRVITNSSYTEVWRWDSDPFGTTAANEDPDDDGNRLVFNLRFPGQYFDAETGLHYNWNRYYDPRLGRYIISDPIGLRGGLNTYAYAKDNPLRWVDPKGLLNEFPGDTEQVYNPCYFSGTCDSDAMIERMKAEARAAGDCLVCVARCEAKVLFGAGLEHIAEKQAEKELEKVADRVAKEFLRRGLKFFGWVGAAQTGFDSIRCLVECK